MNVGQLMMGSGSRHADRRRATAGYLLQSGLRLARAVADWHARRMALALPVDERTLRDIGLTPQGVRESALAARNEARFSRRAA